MTTNTEIQLKQARLGSVEAAAEKFEDDLVRLARTCIKRFGDDGKTQMSNLERTALTARRFGDIVAFVKRQTGKDTKQRTWARREKGRTLGEEILELLDKLKQSADQSCKSPPLEDQRNAVRLMLASAVLRNLHSAFLFEKVKRGGSQDHGSGNPGR